METNTNNHQNNPKKQSTNKNHNTKQVVLFSQALSYAGILPFGILSAVIVFDFYPHFIPLNTHFMLNSYTVVIVSFLSGTIWHAGYHDPRNTHVQKKYSTIGLLLRSNAIALLAWGSFLLCICVTPFKTYVFHPSAVLLCALLLVYALYIDVQLYRSGVWPHSYIKMRTRVTCIVLFFLFSVIGQFFYAFF